MPTRSRTAAAAAAAAALCLALAAAAPAALALEEPDYVLKWNYLDWDFPTQEARDRYYGSNSHLYVGIAGGTRFSSRTGEVFISVPRMTGGGIVPATVARVDPSAPLGPRGQPVARPFPSWEANDPARNDSIRSAFGLQIDLEDRLWVLDSGWIEREPGQPQLLLYANASSDSPALLRRHRFPASVVSPSLSYLNDMAVDQASGMVYVTDSATYAHGRGGLVVYDYRRDVSWRALHAVVSVDPVPGLQLTLNRVPMSPNPVAGADGITICGDTVYYCPITSHDLWQLPKKVLDDQSLSVAQRNASVRRAGLHRDWATDGIACDNHGRVWMGSMDDSSIVRWDAANDARSAITVAHDPVGALWPAVVGFDHNGSVFFLNLGSAGKTPLDISRVNFRVGVFPADALSAQHNVTSDVFAPGGGRGGGGGGGGGSAVVGILLAVGAAVLFVGTVLYYRRVEAARTVVSPQGGSEGTYTPLM